MEFPDKTEHIPTPGVPQKKVIKPVIAGATQVKRPATRRFFDYLFAESPKNLGKKVGREVVVPRLKAGLEEALNSFISGMMWGDGSRPVSGMVRGTMLRGNGTTYAQISAAQPSGLQMARQATVGAADNGGNYKDLIVPTQQDAEVLLANLYDVFNQYRVVTIGDLYEMAGFTASISDNAYGWTNLDGARIRPIGNGYVLELPRPHLI